MKKTVYSLVLGEDVIHEVDRRAYKAGTSRSNLINQLLADQMGLITDERRMGEIYEHAQALIGDLPGLQLSLQSDTVLTVRSALNYKYNPSMRYSVCLTRGGQDIEGELKAALRSQNRELLFHLRRFFTLWMKIEQAYGQSPRSALEGGRFTRLFTIPLRLDDDRLRQTQMIAGYIVVMDAAFSGYFAHVQDLTAAVKEIERLYLDYLKAQKDIF